MRAPLEQNLDRTVCSQALRILFWTFWCFLWKKAPKFFQIYPALNTGMHHTLDSDCISCVNFSNIVIWWCQWVFSRLILTSLPFLLTWFINRLQILKAWKMPARIPTTRVKTKPLAPLLVIQLLVTSSKIDIDMKIASAAYAFVMTNALIGTDQDGKMYWKNICDSCINKHIAFAANPRSSHQWIDSTKCCRRLVKWHQLCWLLSSNHSSWNHTGWSMMHCWLYHKDVGWVPEYTGHDI